MPNPEESGTKHAALSRKMSWGSSPAYHPAQTHMFTPLNLYSSCPSCQFALYTTIVCNWFMCPCHRSLWSVNTLVNLALHVGCILHRLRFKRLGRVVAARVSTLTTRTQSSHQSPTGHIRFSFVMDTSFTQHRPVAYIPFVHFPITFRQTCFTGNLF
jgi:hypothetical protein